LFNFERKLDGFADIARFAQASVVCPKTGGLIEASLSKLAASSSGSRRGLGVHGGSFRPH
jgi:hypothetical protein